MIDFEHLAESGCSWCMLIFKCCILASNKLKHSVWLKFRVGAVAGVWAPLHSRCHPFLWHICGVNTYEPKMFIRKKVGFLVAPQVYETMTTYPKENVNSAYIRCGWLSVEDVAGITKSTPSEVEAAVGSLEETHKSLRSKAVRLHSAHDFSGQQHRSKKWTIVSAGLGPLLSAYDSEPEESQQVAAKRSKATQGRFAAKTRSSKRSLAVFLSDTAKRAACDRAKIVGKNCQKAGENLRAKRAGLPPPHGASTAASSSTAVLPPTADAVVLPPTADAVSKRPKCTKTTIVEDPIFIGAMERVLGVRDVHLTKALVDSKAMLRVKWIEAGKRGENASFGDYLCGYVEETKAMSQMQRVALAQSLIQQQRESTGNASEEVD
jgi:hypothetical protein